MKVEIKILKTSQLLLNNGQLKDVPKNPRFIKDEQFKNLVQSISDFPEMVKIREVVVVPFNDKYVVVGGNMRLRACKELKIKEINCKILHDFPSEKIREFAIKDNNSYGQNDWDFLINEWDEQELKDWHLEIPIMFEEDEDDGKTEDENNEVVSLKDRFIIPPFSVLDTRQGYWQERKSKWKELIKDNGESREGTLYNQNSKNPVSQKIAKIGTVSLLDPVLAEISIQWFGFSNSNILDPFAGDTVFGYVAGYLGNKFTGIKIRKEQADVNNERTKDFECKYICDDGQNVLKHVKENSQDLLFSCPPYFDLEVYSELENDASNQKHYKDFLSILDNAFTDAIKCLKDNRFAVITVGDIRNKKGFYYRFVDDIKDIFKKSGMLLYNELILVECIGTKALRSYQFNIMRKTPKTHQNVLVFYKGDPKEIKSIYPKLDFSDIEQDESTDL